MKLFGKTILLLFRSFDFLLVRLCIATMMLVITHDEVTTVSAHAWLFFQPFAFDFSMSSSSSSFRCIMSIFVSSRLPSHMGVLSVHWFKHQTAIPTSARSHRFPLEWAERKIVWRRFQFLAFSAVCFFDMISFEKLDFSVPHNSNGMFSSVWPCR